MRVWVLKQEALPTRHGRKTPSQIQTTTCLSLSLSGTDDPPHKVTNPDQSSGTTRPCRMTSSQRRSYPEPDMLRFDGGVGKDFSTPHMHSRLSSLEWVECTKRKPAISVVRLAFECTRQPHTQPDRTPMSMLCRARRRTRDSGASQVHSKQLNSCGKQLPPTSNLTCLSSWTGAFC